MKGEDKIKMKAVVVKLTEREHEMVKESAWYAKEAVSVYAKGVLMDRVVVDYRKVVKARVDEEAVLEAARKAERKRPKLESIPVAVPDEVVESEPVGLPESVPVGVTKAVEAASAPTNEELMEAEHRERVDPEAGTFLLAQEDYLSNEEYRERREAALRGEELPPLKPTGDYVVLEGPSMRPVEAAPVEETVSNGDDKLLTEEEFLAHLVAAGWPEDEARAEVQRALAEAAQEDGMGW